MTKQSGLGAGFYVGAYDLSGDVGSLQRISSPRGTTDVTGIDKEAFERLLTTKDGAIDFTAFFNKSNAHLALRGLPTTDIVCTYAHRRTVGAPAACMVAKQTNYDPSRNQDASLTFGVATVANAYGLEWATMLTAGPVTYTGANSGSGVAVDGTGLISLPGSTGAASTPDAAALDITGDLDVRAKVAAADWSPSADQYIVAKYVVTGNQRSYALVLTTTGALAFQFSADGTTAVTKTSTANLSSLAADAVKWVRATIDVDNGASGYTVRFYTSDDGTTWTQLGADVVTATATSIFSGTAPLEVGARNDGAADYLIGKVYEARVYNGIEGTLVANPVFSASGITDSTGKTWTKRTNAVLGSENRFGLQHYVHVLGFTGTDATIRVEHSYDNGVADTWSAVSDGSTAIAGSGSARDDSTATVKRYVRSAVVTTGGFTSLQYVHAVVVNESAVTF